MNRTITLSANTSWYLYNFRASTIARLRESGDQVICIAPRDEYSERLESQLNCRWLPLSMGNRGNTPYRDLIMLKQLIGYYWRLRPSVTLHFTPKNNVYGTLAARMLGVPAINNISGMGTAFVRDGLVPNVVKLLYKLSQPLADTVFCQNQEDFEYLLTEKIVRQEKLELLPGSGVDVRRFRPQESARPRGPFRFLYAGRILGDKGVYELVTAARNLLRQGLQIELWLVGFSGVANESSIDSAQLEAWGSEPGIEWMGPSDAMEDVYSDVDCVVLPSYREGMPKALIEACASGLPVIATNVPGCRSIVRHGFNGLLCEPRNDQSLAQAMSEMLQLTPKDRRTMGMNGRTLIEQNYDEKIVIDATIQAIERAAK